MDNARKATYGNFDEANIASVEKLIQTDSRDETRDKRAFTMLQVNSSCKVEVTQSNRQKCANMLLK